MSKSENSIFIISPVRNLEPSVFAKLLQQDDHYSKLGYRVHIPYRDTIQTENAINICLTNIEEMKKSDFILVYFDEASIGTIYDLGVAMGLGKEIKLINHVYRTENKSFNNVLLDYVRS